MSSSYLLFRELVLKHTGIDQGHWQYFDLGWSFRQTMRELRLMDRG